MQIDQISNNSIIQADLEFSATSKYFDKENFRNKTVLVTGATGFIGKQLILTLLCMDKIHNLNLKIIAIARSQSKVNTIFAKVLNYSNIKFIIQDITQPISLTEQIDFIVHSACPTESKYFTQNPVETIEVIMFGTNNILKLACEKQVESMVYLSSMEVYGEVKNLPEVKETDIGYLDILKPRSSYPEAKRCAENLCVAYNVEYQVPVKIIRLSQVFGAGLDYNDSRVLSQFIRSVIEEKDIVLHTEGKTVITNCYILDAITGILTILTKGKNGESYNLANSKNIFSIKEIAELIAQYNSKSKVIFNIQNLDRYVDTILKVNTDKICTLGWQAHIGLNEMIKRTIASYTNN